MSKIEWTNETWNPIIGCSKVSPGCQNCYAERMARRLSAMGKDGYSEVVHQKTRMVDEDYGHWTGKTAFVESQLEIPLKRKKPAMYFVCSMGDMFHESVPFEWIDKVMAVIALCQQHTFQVLTKRPERMREYFENIAKAGLGSDGKAFERGKKCIKGKEVVWPLRNVWLGVTAENQQQADIRIPILLQIPAAKRFVSVEPMLSAVKIEQLSFHETIRGTNTITRKKPIDWVICGGESGPASRPMHPDWARGLFSLSSGERGWILNNFILHRQKKWLGIRGITGVTGIRLTVSAKRRPAACSITESIRNFRK